MSSNNSNPAAIASATLTSVCTAAVAVFAIVAGSRMVQAQRPVDKQPAGGIVLICLGIILLLGILGVGAEMWRLRIKRDSAEKLRASTSLAVISRQDDVDRLYSLIRRFNKVANKAGLEYFIICGTLIGAVRHGGLMQWDDDVDIGMLDAQAARLHDSSTQAALAAEGLVLDANPTVLKIYDTAYRYPFIDVFPFSSQPPDRLAYSNLVARAKWPKEWFYMSDMYGPDGALGKYAFGPLVLPGPYNALGALKRQFGDNVMTHFYTKKSHQDDDSQSQAHHISQPSLAALQPQHMPPCLPSEHGQ